MLFLLIAALAACAQAQTSGSVALVSDYRFRGVSLSDGRPAPQLNLAYDSRSDWYLGAFASRVVLEGADRVQWLGYAGIAQRLQSGMSWEIGATQTAFGGAAKYNYAELYLGLASERVNGRLYLSPDYFGTGSRTVYAEVNASLPLHRRVHLLAHLGLAQTLSNGEAQADSPGRRFDLRVGVGAGIADWNAQLAWVAAEKTASRYARSDQRDLRAVVLNLSYSF